MDWVRSVGTKNIMPFPLPFAYCKRLEGNPAVYIFDENGKWNDGMALEICQEAWALSNREKEDKR